MFSTVIVGIDGFDGGQGALAMSRALGAGRLVLVSAYPHDPIPLRGSSDGYERLLRADAEAALRTARERSGAEDAELRAVPDNSPARALQRVAAEEGAELIVVGAAHHGPLGSLLVGDVGRSVVHDAPCPVLVAPRRPAGTAPRKIALAYDGSSEAEAALEVAGRLARSGGGMVSVYVAWQEPPVGGFAGSGSAVSFAKHVSDRKAQAETVLREALERLPDSATGAVLHGQPGTVIEHAAAEDDLLVVGSRGWGAVRRIAVGSTSDWLLHHAPCPVLVVPRPAARAHDDAEAGVQDVVVA